MKITQLRADNFKSLVDFDLRLSTFTCLVGLNGSGKSTVLQLLDFVAQQFKGELKEWLKSRQWKAADLNSRLTKKSNITFAVALDSDGIKVKWASRFNRTNLRCTEELFHWDEQPILRVKDGRYEIWEPGKPGASILKGDIAFDYQGSIVSQLKESQLPACLVELKQYFLQLESMDLLSPELLRSRTREAKGKLGIGGQNLSAFIFELDKKKRNSLFESLKQIYPQLATLHVGSLHSGWKSLSIEESYRDLHLPTDARHINDGMLRIMAVLSQLFSNHSFLLFDEIENGINPELVEFLMAALVNSEKQVLVTTHSPMILNYLDDEVARKGVIYLYKTPQGFTHSIPLFDIPSLKEKLTVMGPGEAFVDTELTQLANEITYISQQ